jgi:hypothetical protein
MPSITVARTERWLKAASLSRVRLDNACGMVHVHLFPSTMPDDFRIYPERLRHLLTRPDVEVTVQEDFILPSDESLETLLRAIQG